MTFLDTIWGLYTTHEISKHSGEQWRFRSKNVVSNNNGLTLRVTRPFLAHVEQLKSIDTRIRRRTDLTPRHITHSWNLIQRNLFAVVPVWDKSICRNHISTSLILLCFSFGRKYFVALKHIISPWLLCLRSRCPETHEEPVLKYLTLLLKSPVKW